MAAIGSYVVVCSKTIWFGIFHEGISTVPSKIRWLTLALLLLGNAHATTVIAVTTDTSAYIGADSRTRPQGSICKIVVANGVAVGMSGLLADQSTDFNAANTIRSALGRARNLSAAIDSTIVALEPSLKRSLEWGFKNSPSEYSRYQGKNALALLFVGIQNGTPQISYFAWRTDNGGVSRLPIRNLGANAFNGIGTFDAIVSYVARTPEWRSMSPVERIVKALQIESDASPDDVGPPFSILRIDLTRKGEWIERGACNPN